MTTERTDNFINNLANELSEWFKTMPDIEDPSQDLEGQALGPQEFLLEVVDRIDETDEFVIMLGRLLLYMYAAKPSISVEVYEGFLSLSLGRAPHPYRHTTLETMLAIWKRLIEHQNANERAAMILRFLADDGNVGLLAFCNSMFMQLRTQEMLEHATNVSDEERVNIITFIKEQRTILMSQARPFEDMSIETSLK